MARLTFFNARRGGEPSRFIKNWLDAERDMWLDKQMLANLDPVDQLLAKSMKVGYQGGKGLGLVPVLFPQTPIWHLRRCVMRKYAEMPVWPKETTSYFQASDPWNMFLDGMHCIVCARILEIWNALMTFSPLPRTMFQWSLPC